MQVKAELNENQIICIYIENIMTKNQCCRRPVKTASLRADFYLRFSLSIFHFSLSYFLLLPKRVTSNSSDGPVVAKK